MSTDLERAVQFANPVTGEVLTLDSPTQDLASYMADLRELESRVREHKAVVNRELLSRMDRQRKWTLNLEGGLKLTAPSDEPSDEWDGAALYETLCELADEDLITMDAVNAAVEMVVDYKVKKAGVNALRKNARLAELIEPFRSQVEKPRYVRVSRA